ncbi:MAG: HU family DNA-binding protein [bacterium]|nr:HU family DNA-binding protein [bacterium]
MNELELYPDIHDYLDSVENSKSVNISGLNELVYTIMAHTGLNYEVASIVCKSFFQVIRNAILRGEVVVLSGFGKFFVSSPKSTNNKYKVFIKFMAFPQLLNKLNDKRNRH